MTALVWDQVGERRYETGLDHGVLYPPDGDAVPWNGLISITPGSNRETKGYHLDGMKYMEAQVVGSYTAKLQAYTYPDILDSLMGIATYADGVAIHNQRGKRCHLSYRTKIANDLEGEDHGYKIHIVYNVLAVPSDFAYNTLGSSAQANPFEWDLTTLPQRLEGYGPVSHISLDSRFIAPELLSDLEETLYGTVSTDPTLPDLDDLLALV